VFGRGKSQAAAHPGDRVETAKQSGKGRPTPTRRQAEQRNRRPLVGGSALAPNASRGERKAARKARREVASAERLRQRQAMLTGDEANLPARDRGPARRWTRDYVDARRNVGEYFLPVALAVLGMSLLPRTQIISMILLYTVLLAVIVDSVLLRRTLKRSLDARFGDKAAGAAGYGMSRALQFRRWRMPRPRVARGEYPK